MTLYLHNIYTPHTNYLHNIYTLSTHYLHNIYTLSRADGDGQMVTAAVKMMERGRYGDNPAIKL